ncbi:MAG: rhodanese-like domain-containing protein [Blautia sp.]
MFPVEPISAKMLDYYVGRKDAFLIDLSTREAFQRGHIRGAINVPYERFEEMQEYRFSKGKELLILYCERGVQALLKVGQLSRQKRISDQNGDRWTECIPRP